MMQAQRFILTDRGEAIRGLLRSRRFLAGLVCALLAMLALTAAWPRGHSANHITEAGLLQNGSDAYTMPSRTVDPDRLAGRWRTVRLPYQPLPQFLTGSTTLVPDAGRLTTTWFRLVAPPADSLRPPLYLFIPRWKTDGQIAIYVDGRLTYQSHSNNQWNGSDQPLWVALEETAESRTPHEVMVRMQHVAGIGGSISSIWLGGYDDIAWRYFVRNFFVTFLPYMSSVAFLATGLFTLGVWLVGRREPAYLLYFLMSVAAFIRTLQTYVGVDRLPVSDALFGWVTLHSLFWMLVIIHLFLEQIHKRPQPWLTRGVVGVALVCALVTVPAAPLLDPTLSAPLIYVCMLVVGNVICLSGLWQSWRAGEPEGIWLAGSGVLGVLLGIYDWLLQNNLVNIEGLYISLYVNIFLTILFGRIMLRRYVVALSSVEQASRNLADQLARREAELAESYAKLRTVEERETLSRERQRMMQDMHDGMGSSLVTALRAAEHGKLGEVEMVQVLKDCIDDLKLTIDSMEPVETDLLLLVATLRFRLQPRLESTGIKLVWQVEEVPPITWLDQRNCLHILRILQEAFTNTIKHARASTIVMTTRSENNNVVITIVDDGVGFDLGGATDSGKGLSNQAGRAKAIGAGVDWTSDSEGTRFRLSLPVTRAREDGRPDSGVGRGTPGNQNNLPDVAFPAVGE